MHHSRFPARQTLRRAALVVALIVIGTGAAAAKDATGTEPTATVAHMLPTDRSIALIESLDPANAGVTFILAPSTDQHAASRLVVERVNICIPCDELV